MTPRFLHMGFTWRGDFKTTELEPAFNMMADDWIRYGPNNWIVYTARPASDYLYALKPYMGPNDSVLIIGLNMGDRNGWQAKWVWEWMDRKRELGPPPPPAPPPSDLGLLGALYGSGPRLPMGGLFGLGELPKRPFGIPPPYQPPDKKK